MNPDQKNRLLELANGHIEQKLSADEISELEALLDSSAEARRIFTDFMHDHASLHWDHISATEEENIEDFEVYRPSRLPSLPQLLAAAAVVALLALVLIRPEAAPESFATMETTEAARWESSNLPTGDGSRLNAGELRLSEGLATIAFDSGATVVLEGPAQLELIDSMNCLLKGGTAVTEVEESAQGFRIETPRANVIDHGTRFVVNVDPRSGATKTQVFEGLVEVQDPSSDESVELHTGQRNFVAGEGLGEVGDSPEEGTWSSREDKLIREGNWRTISTAYGDGTDGYVHTFAPADHISNELLLIKNGKNSARMPPHRKAYLRFDLSRFAPDSIEEAELSLQFTPTGWGLASLLSDSVFEVFGLTDDSGDDWVYGEADWETAPGNEGIQTGNELNPEKVVSLGTFTLPRGAQSGVFQLDGALLTQFLNEDQNRLATLIIVRQTSENEAGGLVHAIASKRHPTLPAPSLSVKLR
ncbi:MAG: FecR domain-containing protein [Verrucomicrobiales bacterium]|nr:FecR domain-containing protein [Verrucomicrobiales bacterium]